MLLHIQIRDFAIIDAAELELASGLTVLTGETGAGKSILVDALLLAAGGRAGAEVVRHGAERAEVSATFAIAKNPPRCAWLAEQSIEHEDECVLRRIVGADGRSRAYVNSQAMPVQALAPARRNARRYPRPDGISVADEARRAARVARPERRLSRAARFALPNSIAHGPSCVSSATALLRPRRIAKRGWSCCVITSASSRRWTSRPARSTSSLPSGNACRSTVGWRPARARSCSCCAKLKT